MLNNRAHKLIGRLVPLLGEKAQTAQCRVALVAQQTLLVERKLNLALLIIVLENLAYVQPGVPEIQSGDISGYGGNFLPQDKGRNVGSAFTEVNVPLIRTLEATGAVRYDSDDSLADLRPGQVVEVTVTKASQLGPLVEKLLTRLREDHLAAVSVGRLMHDAGAPV